MKTKFKLRNILLVVCSLAVALGVFGAVRANTPAAIQVNADGESTVFADYTKTYTYNDVYNYYIGSEGTHVSEVSSGKLALASANNQNTGLFLYDSGTTTKNSIITLTFNSGTTSSPADNTIRSGSTLRLRHGSSDDIEGGNITIASSDSDYVLTSVTIVADSTNNANDHTNIVITSLSDTSIAVENVTGLQDTADIFPSSTSYTFSYRNNSGFKSFYLSNRKKNNAGNLIFIKSITVTYILATSTYTVDFDTGVGGTAIASQEVISGRTATRPAVDPQMESTTNKYEFDDWYVASDSDTKFDFSSAIMANTTVYAKYTVVPDGKYSITFVSNGGSSVSNVLAYPGYAFEKPDDPTRVSVKYVFSFDCWCADEALTEEYDWDTVASKDITLYAKWTTDSYTALPDGAYEYNTQNNIHGESGWGTTLVPYGTTVLDSWYTFDQAMNNEELIWTTVGVKSTRGLYIQGDYNTIVKGGATATFSLSEYSQKVITFVRIELRNWYNGETISLYAKGVAVDSQEMTMNKTGVPAYLLQGTFDPSDEVTSVSFSIATDIGQIFVKNIWICVADSPAKAKANAIAELNSLESDYSAATWATVASTVSTAKTNIASATTVSEVNTYLATAMTAVAALDEGNTHFVGANVTLDESLALNIYAYIPDAVDPATVTMNFSYGGGAFAKTVAGVSTETANEYKFTYAGISPHHMGDAITTAMYVGGEEFATKEFLMTNYFNALLSMTYSELEMTKAQYKAMRTLIGDLCDYGAAAQTYKSYNTGDLVNEDFAEFASAAVDATLGTRSVTGSAVSGASFRGVSVYFDGENKLYIVINAEDETVANVTVKVTVGEGPQMTFGYSDFTKDSDGVYYFCTQSVKATEFASTITAVIYYGETEGQTLSYSVQSYVYAMQGGGDATAALVKALWKYGLSAVAFNEA